MIIQSDQGIQYQNSRYSDLLKEYKIVQSMSRKGNCLDNSPTENFFGRLKEEIWYNKEYKYENSKDLIKEIHNYIKYYNETKIVTRLKTSPINDRPYQIEVEYFNINRQLVQEVFEGFKTTVFSHEFDHLNGILHIDLADDITEMTYDETKDYRDKHPYEVISKDADYTLIKQK